MVPSHARLVMALLAVSSTVLMGSATGAASAAGDGSACEVGVGSRTPIVLVHGYNANEGSWSAGTRELLAAPRERFCTTAFDYGPASTFWVTNKQISAALSTRVLALANASRRGGGAGKVVVVAHSMGGLAIRCAASSACGGSDAVGPLLRAVVTFDTPNLGTYLKGYGLSHVANAVGNFLGASCRVTDPFDSTPVLRGICGQVRALGTSDAAKAFTPGSDELRDLPQLPATVPVLAVAGSVKVGTSFWGRAPKIIGDAGDLIVNQDSAFAAARTVGGVGGKVNRDCGVLDLTVPVPQVSLTCTHVSETNNPEWVVLVTQLIRKIDSGRSAVAITATSVAGVPFGTSLRDGENLLIAALGKPSERTSGEDCDDGIDTYLRWGGFSVGFDGSNDGSTAGSTLSSWFLSKKSGTPRLGLPHGLTVGVTSQQVRARTNVVEASNFDAAGGGLMNVVLTAADGIGYGLDTRQEPGTVEFIGQGQTGCE